MVKSCLNFPVKGKEEAGKSCFEFNAMGMSKKQPEGKPVIYSCGPKKGDVIIHLRGYAIIPLEDLAKPDLKALAGWQNSAKVMLRARAKADRKQEQK